MSVRLAFPCVCKIYQFKTKSHDDKSILISKASNNFQKVCFVHNFIKNMWQIFLHSSMYCHVEFLLKFYDKKVKKGLSKNDFKKLWKVKKIVKPLASIWRLAKLASEAAVDKTSTIRLCWGTLVDSLGNMEHKNSTLPSIFEDKTLHKLLFLSISISVLSKSFSHLTSMFINSKPTWKISFKTVRFVISTRVLLKAVHNKKSDSQIFESI